MKRLILLSLIAFVWLPVSAVAEGLISCKYLKGSGSKIELQLDISSPPPPTIIILQYLPAGVEILKSRPKMKKYNKERGQARWLLKDVRPGSMTVMMELNKAVDKGTIKGELRYRNPESGSMETMEIHS
ncbi:MAG: hypothetical protein J7L69_10490 [Desulfobulbaceae bacterium]|nr:hypothetical protein [Desulfobulbaceae bacterium]